MTNLQSGAPSEASLAYRDGWRSGLALGALAIAVVAFINLLSMEKSILAAVLAIVAIKGAGKGPATRRGRLALGIAVLHLAFAATVLTLLHDKLGRLFHLLQTLG